MIITRPGLEAVPLERVDVSAYTFPTEHPESDGTMAWSATTVVVVEVHAGPVQGLGYSYTTAASAELLRGVLVPAVLGLDAMAVPLAWQAMVRAVRNMGRPGVASGAISALDTAIWDLKSKLLGLPLVTLLGAARTSIPVYGSGGFTDLSFVDLAKQLEGWAQRGFGAVKMKVGSQPELDARRVARARDAVGPRVGLYVDANGAYDRKQALALAEAFAAQGVQWFEEPVSSDDLEGLRLVRDRAPAGVAIAAGEYGYDPVYFRRMLEAGAVDVLQADATRCLGVTGFLKAGALAEAFMLPLSAHTAPSLHLHLCCALPAARNLEYFHDHALLEPLLFDGVVAPANGELRPDLTRPGLGLTLKRVDAARYEV